MALKNVAPPPRIPIRVLSERVGSPCYRVVMHPDERSAAVRKRTPRSAASVRDELRKLLPPQLVQLEHDARLAVIVAGGVGPEDAIPLLVSIQRAATKALAKARAVRSR